MIAKNNMTDEQLWKNYVREKGLVCDNMRIVKDGFLAGLKIGRGVVKDDVVTNNRLKDRINSEIEWLKSDEVTREIMVKCPDTDSEIDEFAKQMRLNSKTHATMIDVRKHFFNWLNFKELRVQHGTNSSKKNSEWRTDVLDRINRLANSY